MYNCYTVLSTEPRVHLFRSLYHLQGHIGLDTAVWPEGTPGCALDTLARTPLWALGLNYRQALVQAGFPGWFRQLCS